MPRILLPSAALSVALTLVGCGASATASTEPATVTASTSESTTGGEAAPIHLETTTPVPVPQPGVPRGQLSAPTQAAWSEVERAIAERPPEPPADADETAMNAWYQGPFRAWIVARIAARDRAEAHANELESAPSYERGVAAGLIGYLHEQTAAEARGAPIPTSIGSDAELLAIYRHSLDEALAPVALRAVEAYRFCVAAFDELAPDAFPAWEEWRAYCEDRAGELVRVYTGHDAVPAGDAATE